MARSIRPSGRAVKAEGVLGELSDIRKQETVILGKVQEHLLKKYSDPSTRRKDIIHPSEMAKSSWCPRQTFLRIMTGESEESKFNFQRESMFEEGNLIHTKWQGWLNDMGLLWGTWKCWCDRHRTWTATSPRACPFCNSTVGIEYLEVPLSAEKEYMIVGHADGGIPSVNSLIEIKSIGIGTLRFEAPTLLSKYQVETTDGKKIYDVEALWKGITGPFPSHIKQGQIYLRLCNLMGLEFDRIVFLYENKANQSFKEFTIPYVPDITDQLFDYALDIKYAVDNMKPASYVPCLCNDKGPCNKEKNAIDSAETRVSARGRTSISRSKDTTSQLQSQSTGETEGRDTADTQRSNRSIRRTTNDSVSGDSKLDGLHRRQIGARRS
jgi:hypothetical protein